MSNAKVLKQLSLYRSVDLNGEEKQVTSIVGLVGFLVLPVWHGVPVGEVSSRRLCAAFN